MYIRNMGICMYLLGSQIYIYFRNLKYMNQGESSNTAAHSYQYKMEVNPPHEIMPWSKCKCKDTVQIICVLDQALTYFLIYNRFLQRQMYIWFCPYLSNHQIPPPEIKRTFNCMQSNYVFSRSIINITGDQGG